MTDRADSRKVKAGRSWQEGLFQRLARGPLWYEITDPDLSESDPARRVIVKLGYALDGRPRISGLLIGAEGDREISTRLLRYRIPLGALLDVVSDPKHWSGSMSMREVRPLGGRPKGSRRARGGKVDLSQVVEDYRAMLVRHPRSPMKALADHYGVKEVGTARKWIRQAEAEGLMQPRKSGRADRLKESTRRNPKGRKET